jgi:hypothetical protein
MASQKKKVRGLVVRRQAKWLDVDISWYSAVKISKIDISSLFVPEVEKPILSLATGNDDNDTKPKLTHGALTSQDICHVTSCRGHDLGCACINNDILVAARLDLHIVDRLQEPYSQTYGSTEKGMRHSFLL